MSKSPVLGLFAVLPVVTGGALLVLRSHRDAVTLLTGFVGLLFVLPARWVVQPFGAVGSPALLLGVGLAWCWWAAKVLPTSGLARGFQPVRLAVLAYGWYLVGSYALAYLRPLTELEASGAHRALITLVSLAGVALLSADGVASRERLDVLLRRVVAGGVFMALVGMVQFFLNYDPTTLLHAVPGIELNRGYHAIGERSFFNRPYGTGTHSIEFGVILGVVLPLALHYAFHSAGRPRVRAWLSALVIAAGIPLSLSRSGVVAVVVGLGVLSLVWGWRRRLNVLMGALGLSAVMWAVIPGLIGTLIGLFTNTETDPSVQARTRRIPRMLALLSERPWFGRGNGTYSVEDYFLLDNELYVQAISIGVVGVAVLIGLLAVAMATARGAATRADDEPGRQLGQAIVACLAALTVNIATFDAFYYRIFTGLLFLFIGAAGALWRLTRQSHSPLPSVEALGGAR